MEHSSTPPFAIVAIVRNELPYLVEWIAHHRVIGFNRFYVADNESNDGTSEVLAALARRGIVQTVSFPTPAGRAPQFLAYEQLLRDLTQEDEWVAVIDADEFILPLGAHRDVRSPIAPLLAAPDVGAIAINWACYGSSWRKNWTPGLVMERFVRRAHQKFGPNQHYKTILRRRALDRVLQNPHHFALKPGFRYARPDGTDLRLHERFGQGLSTNVLWDGLRVNHYLVKSRQEFDENKSPKGRVSVVGGTKGTRYFVGHDQNDVGDPVPTWLSLAVSSEVAALLLVLNEAGVEVLDARPTESLFEQPFPNVRAHIDTLELREGVLRARGWALHWSGLPPLSLALEVAGERHLFMGYEHRKRSDLVRSYPMACEYCGFDVSVAVAQGTLTAKDVRLFAGYGPETPFGPFLTNTLVTS